jgi:Tol biopolymer transport system component
MKKFALLLPLLMIAAANVAQNLPTRRRVLDYNLVFTQVPFRSGQHKAKSGRFLLNRASGRGSRVVLLGSSGSITVLTPEFSAASDPAVSFDGRRILFSGKKELEDNWDIWEMDLDGRNKRRITKDFGDCREPEYLAKSAITPPDFTDKVRWITFTSNRAAVNPEILIGAAGSLYVTNLEPIEGKGVVTWRTTFNLCSDFSPTVLRDGRVLFSSEQGCDSVSQREFPLLAANWDGSGLNLFCSSGQGSAFKTMAAETADRNLVFIESDDAADVGGRLARVSFRRPLRSYQLLSRDHGDYLNPRPLPDGRLVVSCASGTGSYGIYLFDFEKGSPGEKLFADSRWEALDAQLVVQTPEPQGLISSVVDSLQWGDLFCLNVYDSDLHGAGGESTHDVKYVRFYQGESRILGTAPVEEDGSFFVRLPGDTPFRMQLLDAQKNTVRTMSRWIWVRRGTSRGCVGCHENKEMGPENRVPAAILRGEPYDLVSGIRQ